MLGMKLHVAKGLFFDRARVTNAVDRTTRRNLSRFGAFVRRRARSSIRTRRRISDPGQPPTNRTGLLKRNIFFVYEPNRRSVVIGPVLLNKSSGAPELLEHGGTVIRRIGGRSVRMTYRPRPYMGPAFEAEQDRLEKLWRNSVR
jgi:hypothetical protein